MTVETRCYCCGALALVGFGTDPGSRLTIVQWVCRHCHGDNASAFDWEYAEVVPALVGRQHAKQWRDQPRGEWPWGLNPEECDP